MFPATFDIVVLWLVLVAEDGFNYIWDRLSHSICNASLQKFFVDDDMTGVLFSKRQQCDVKIFEVDRVVVGDVGCVVGRIVLIVIICCRLAVVRVETIVYGGIFLYYSLFRSWCVCLFVTAQIGQMRI